MLASMPYGQMTAVVPTFSGKPGKNSAPLTGKELTTWLMTYFPENGKKSSKKETLTFVIANHVVTTGMETGNKTYDASPRDVTALRLALGFDGNKEVFTQFLRDPEASKKFTTRLKAQVAEEKAAKANAPQLVDATKELTPSTHTAQRRWTA